MDMIDCSIMRWQIASAKQQLSEVVRQAAQEPQLLFNREHLVAAVVGEEVWREFDAWRAVRVRPSIAAALDEVRRITAEDGYELETPIRGDRANPFVTGAPRARRKSHVPRRHQRP